MCLAAKLNSAPKYVVSTTLKKADWNNTTIINGNVVETIKRLKQQPEGDIHIEGSATLVKTETFSLGVVLLCYQPVK